MTMRRHIQAVCVLSSLAFGAVAHADDAAMAEAQARFNEGLELADNAKYEEARLKFLQAVVVLKAPSLLFNLASTEMKTGHEVDAIEHYRAFLKSGANDTRITDALREKARQNISELLKKVLQVDIEAPEGSKISVDGKPLDESAQEPVPVAPGKHVIEASFSGKVRSVSVEGSFGETVKAKLDFDSGEPTTYAPPTIDDSRQRPTAGWVVPIALGVLGLGGVVVGGVMASSATSAKDDSENLRRTSPGLCAPPGGPTCTAYDDKRDTAKSQATLAWVGYATGGVLLAASIATFVFWPKSAKTTTASPSIKVTPLLGREVAGGSFTLPF